MRNIKLVYRGLKNGEYMRSYLDFIEKFIIFILSLREEGGLISLNNQKKITIDTDLNSLEALTDSTIK